MNRILITFSLFLASSFTAVTGRAQTNSVQLYDGLGNLISSHFSIQDAYNAIPSTLSQAYDIEISNNYNAVNEIFPITFVDKPGADANNTISVTLASSINLLTVYYGGDTSSMFILDDADWVIINGLNSSGSVGLHFYNLSSAFNYPTIQLINGACHNTINRCDFANGYWLDPTPLVYLGTSPANSSGNSDNEITRSRLNANTIGILSEGTPANPNNNTRIYGNNIDVLDVAIWQRQGTGNMYIDSNALTTGSGYNTGEFSTIRIDSLADSTIVTKNRIGIYIPDDEDLPSRCVYLGSTTGTGAYAYLANNYLYIHTYLNWTDIMFDSLTYCAGLEFNGSYPVKADIYNNTIRIRGKLTNGNNNPAFSACFKRAGSHPGSVFDIRNNIFSNDRYGGGNSEHYSMQFDNTAGTMNINNNTYNTGVPTLVKYNNIVYTSFTAYQSAIGGGNETGSNTVPVEFIYQLAPHLYGSSVNNTALYGIPIPGINEDIEGDTRVHPYKGCDEYEVNCMPPLPGTVTSWGNNLCPGDTFILFRGIQLTGNGRVYQWQSRPAATTVPFTDIPGATHPMLVTTAYQSTEYRMVDSCVTGGLVSISNPTTVIINPLPTVSGIAETHTGFIFDFTSYGLTYTTSYLWDFGDGSAVDTNIFPQHTYPGTGTYTVTLIVSNGCGSDTATYTVTIPVVGVEEIELSNLVSLYPNPATNEVRVASANMMINEVTVYNITGTFVLSESGKNKVIKLNTGTLPAGLYVLRINTDKGTCYKQLQVLR